MSGIVRTSDIAREGGVDRLIRRRAERGEILRVARGRYLPTAEWESLDHDGRYLARIHAFAETTRSTQVFSHWSAAALWGYPIIGAWPARIDVTLPRGTGQRSTTTVARHVTELDDEDVVEHDGVLVTSPLRTLVDLARCAPFVTGVAACDRALAVPRTASDTVLHVERDALLERANLLAGQRGVCQLRCVADFSDGRSGSPGESLSRVQIARLRFPAPDLQTEVVDLDGRVWHTDFGWREQGVLGEFDGIVKYTRDCYVKGRELPEVVVEEKLREDAIRAATKCSVVRWTWSVASDLNHMKQLLLGAGLRPE